jgi:hypothetical protein
MSKTFDEIIKEATSNDVDWNGQMFVFEFFSNFIEGHAKDFLEGQLPAAARSQLEAEIEQFRENADKFKAAVEPLRSVDPERMRAILKATSEMTFASFGLGLAFTYSQDALREFNKLRAAAAQKGNKEQATLRRRKLRVAIIKAAADQALVASDKFASSIKAEVRQNAGVDSKAVGYSARTIQREISAILSERGEN